MTPLLQTAFRQAIDQATQLNHQAECFNHSVMPEELVTNELVREIECTPQGMLLYPMHDPMDVVHYFKTRHQLVFSREKNFEGTYDWVTTWPDQSGFALWIKAGENIDLTGTILQPNQH